MQRKPAPQTLAAAFLLLSAGLSVVVLGMRNLSDDEILSFDLIAMPVRKILSIAADGDVHPPGMYLLAHAAWRILPSFRWMNLFPALLLYAGLAVFLTAVLPLFARTGARLCLLLMATLHPQLLMWGATVRWYSWWTGLALIALIVALQPRKVRPEPSTRRALALGGLMACLFYLNYITLLFGLALGVAMAVRYRGTGWKAGLRGGLIVAGVFAALIAPQLRTMLTVHLPNSGGQRYSVAISFLRLLQSISASEAYLPWHPLAILDGLVFLGLCGVGLRALGRHWRREQERSADSPRPASGRSALILFGGVFFLLLVFSGLGGKPRNGLLLIPVAAVAVASIAERLRAHTQTALLVFLVLWSAVGFAHLVERRGLTKAGMNERPEEVAGFVARDLSAGGAAPGCAVVVTYDSGLAFVLAHSGLPRTLIVSPFRSPILGAASGLPPDGCARPRLYAVESYAGGDPRHAHAFDRELGIAEQFMEGEREVDAFSRDADVRTKRALARASRDLAPEEYLPNYRYVVTSGVMERSCLAAMRRQMPNFLSGFVESVHEALPDASRLCATAPAQR